MKVIHRVLMLVALIGLFSTPVFAEDKIYSLAVKEHEIESAIHKAISTFLSRGEYVLKVRLDGTREEERIRKYGPREIVTEPTDALPGFEPEETTTQPKITETIGDKYWKIKQLKVNLIIHKEITSSLYEYIEKTIKVISGYNATRGDIINLDSIPPVTPAEEQQTNKENSIPPVTLAEEQQTNKENGGLTPNLLHYGLTVKEWIYLGVFVFLTLLIVILLWKITRMKSNLTTLVDSIEGGGIQAQSDEIEEALDELKKAKQDRLKKQEEQLREELIRDENDKTAQDIIAQLVGRQDFAQQMVEEYGQQKQGIEKITKLIAILGPYVSRRLLSDPMGKDQYLKLEEMAEELELKPQEEKTLLREIQKILFTKQLLAPEDKKLDPFSFLYKLTPDQLAFLIKPEPIKIKAIVLSRLSSMTASSIIARLPKEERGQVVLLLGNMRELPSEIGEKVAIDLAVKAQHVPESDAASFNGVNMLVDVMGEIGTEVRHDIINSLRVSDRKLSAAVERRFFLFESIPVVPKDVLTAVIRKLPAEDVITAINGSSRQLQKHVIFCFPQKIQRALVAALKKQRPDPETVREKRRKIVLEMQKMGENKQIDLRKIHAEWEKVSSKRSSA